MSTPDPTTAIATAGIELLVNPPVRFHCERRGPLMQELNRVLEWVYAHEHRGEHVSEDLRQIVDRLEYRALMRGNDHLPLDENEAS